MADINQMPNIELSVTLRLTESEARAFDALVGYGDDAFLKCFYQHLGESYMRPHEAGLRSMFKSVREKLPPILHRTDDARAVFAGLKVAKRPDTTQERG